ncbi:DUF2585 family protein [Acidimangrovimonas pyrenivorans]|uniref:DUF2585 family protein n=1 Tax=Acidimangrovimonas pyrenivorans TaxID=2030798 RepID=A0ABV7AF47_9RHOB
MLDRRLLPYWVTLFIVLLGAAVLLAMGRSLICPCGTVLPWYGPTGTPDANMHLTDWYTPSHLLHGFLFFFLLRLVARRVPIGWRLVAATALEVGWEILENTNWTIDRYRSTTVSTDYIGDSVVNSVTDVTFMLLGFWLARRLPVWASLAICIGFELLTAVVIRDGLTLNVIMFIHPMDWILNWQTAG